MQVAAEGCLWLVLSNKAGSVQEMWMNALDRKLHGKLQKLENLEAIEARLARQETKARITLIVVMVLATMGFALLLGHIFSPSWLPLGH